MLLSDFARPKGAKDKKPRKTRSDKGKKRNIFGKLAVAGGLGATGAVLGSKLARKQIAKRINKLNKLQDKNQKTIKRLIKEEDNITKTINKKGQDIGKEITNLREILTIGRVNRNKDIKYLLSTNPLKVKDAIEKRDAFVNRMKSSINNKLQQSNELVNSLTDKQNKKVNLRRKKQTQLDKLEKNIKDLNEKTDLIVRRSSIGGGTAGVITGLSIPVSGRSDRKQKRKRR